MTYSILAKDPITGDLGVAMQTYWFDVASQAMWATAGVGAVATQATADPSYGHNGLELMRRGVDPQEALARLQHGDEGREHRQVAFVSADGQIAAHTGSECMAHAGMAIGDGVVAQGNMLRSAGTWDAMIEAYEAAEGALGTRLLAGLHAAEASGGDVRGTMFASIRVVRGTRPKEAWKGTVLDLRVEHSSDPLGEMARLLRLQEAYVRLEYGFEVMASGDFPTALQNLRLARSLAPGDNNVVYALALCEALSGREIEGAQLLNPIMAAEPGWRQVLSAETPATVGFDEESDAAVHLNKLRELLNPK
jgi:uncharacterized Ntn-hydrolase superfamily protein